MIRKHKTITIDKVYLRKLIQFFEKVFKNVICKKSNE